MSQDVARPSAEQLLRQAGLRVTKPRVAVLGTLPANPHAGADTVLRVVRHGLGTVSTQGVYDVLHVLAERGGLLPATSCVPATTTTASCAASAATSRTSTAQPARRPTSTPPTPRGFVVAEAEVTYWGTCPDCQNSTTHHDPHEPASTNQQGVSNA